jgi:hypothetical protein
MSAKQKPAPQPEPAAEPKDLVQHDAREAMTAVEYATQFAVTNASDSAKGQEARARLNSRIKDLNERRLKITRKIDESKREVMELFAGPISQFTQARDLLDAKVIAWDAEQDRLRKIEQARLDKIAEDERKRLQAIADEAKRKADAEAEQLRKDAEAAAAAGRAAEAAKLSARAVRVEEKAEAKAETFETRASSVVAPIAQAQVASVAGTQFRDHYEFEILDATKINASFMTPDLVKIGAVVKSLKKEAVGVVGAGLKVTSRKILASGRT